MDYHLNESFKNKYNILKQLGKGEYTEVYKVENKNTKEIRAIKIIKLEDIKLGLLKKKFSREEANKRIKYIVNDIKIEINHMKICAENNINSVKYYEAFETENELVLVLELCDYSLKKLINQKNKDFYPDDIYEILNQLNNSFKIMEKNKIIHRNLKPDNILIKKVK